MSFEQGYVSYRYGEKHLAPVVRFVATGTNAAFLTVLFPFHGPAPTVSIRCEPECTELRRIVRIIVEQHGMRWEDHLALDFEQSQSECKVSEVAGLRFRGTGVVREEADAVPRLLQPVDDSADWMLR